MYTSYHLCFKNLFGENNRLCNACGLHYQAMMRNEKLIPVVQEPKPVTIQDLLNPVSSNNSPKKSPERRKKTNKQNTV